MTAPRDHGGGVDAAAARWGGSRDDWLDLSTGINPDAFPLPPLHPGAWTDLPDSAAEKRLVGAARTSWNVPEGAGVLAAPGVSALIALLPRLGGAGAGAVRISAPTYNEHAASFAAEGWRIVPDAAALAQVAVHPNNPDGRLWSEAEVMDAHRRLTVIDESFCDVCPERSLVHLASRPGVVVLKGLGKFWGLAGLRLGFAVAAPPTISRLREMIGPWAVSGPALAVGAAALEDAVWAEATRAKLQQRAERLDTLMTESGATQPRGTTLFRLYDVPDARAWQDRLARAHIWTRVFPWSETGIRLGLPGAERDWARLQTALRG